MDMDSATWVIAVFTIVLAIATIWNIKITRGLLKRSKTAFVIDIIDGLMRLYKPKYD